MGRATAVVGGDKESAAAAEFHPESVIDQALTKAADDVAAMPSSELREFAAMFDVCTMNKHPVDRQGKCAAVSKRYKVTYAKDRAVDRAIAELERVVRFQRMFRATGALTTEYEDRINEKLREPAKIALATMHTSAQVSVKKKSGPQKR